MADIHNLIDKDHLWQKINLPLKYLVIGLFNPTSEKFCIAQRKKFNVTKDNFNNVLSELSPHICFSIPNYHANDNKLTINLNFKHMKDFRPEHVVEQVPELKQLLMIRKLIKNLNAEIKSNEKLYVALKKISKDKNAVRELQLELQTIFCDGMIAMSCPHYKAFCEHLSCKPILRGDEIGRYEDLKNQFENERLTMLLFAFIECAANEENEISDVDEALLDFFIQKIDASISQQLDSILHHLSFQEIEKSWRELFFIVEQVDEQVIIEMLNVSKVELEQDFKCSSDIENSGLYRQVGQYDLSHNIPSSAIISGYEFTTNANDITLLENISTIAEKAQCPFIGSVDARFFGKETFEEVLKIHALSDYLCHREFDEWNAFRQKAASYYVGLTCPTFLLRSPYRLTHARRFLPYHEDVYNNHHQYLWGASSFIFAAGLAQMSRPKFIAKDANYSETQAFIDHGLIPIMRERAYDFDYSYAKNLTYQFQLSENLQSVNHLSIHKQLSYIFIKSRMTHYVKFLQHAIFRIHCTRGMLEATLNTWLEDLIEKFSCLNLPHSLKGSKIEIHSFNRSEGICEIILRLASDLHYEGEVFNLSLCNSP